MLGFGNSIVNFDGVKISKGYCFHRDEHNI